MFYCQACGQSLIITDRVGFKEECPRCTAQLHCCLNCKFYTPGMHNDCQETQADRVVDKDRANFCEYFAFVHREQQPNKSSLPEQPTARDRFQSLFSSKKPVK